MSPGGTPDAGLPLAVSAAARPVFVVGMNGSGTTMLLDCLGRHHALFAFPRETRLIPYLISRQERYGDLAVDANFLKLWNDVRNLPVFRQVNAGREPPLPDNWRDFPRTLPAILDAIFRHFAARENKQRWCEKTPQHIQHLPALAELFPDAKFIHVIRDGRDCAASFQRRWGRKPELTIFRWKKVVEKGKKDGRQLGAGRYLELHYETLTAEPERSLRELCDFLDISFDPAVLESSQPYMEAARRGGDRGLKPNFGKWQQQFSERRQDKLERIAGATLASHGYQTRHPLADEDPGIVQRRYWAACEVFTQYSRELMAKLTGRIERPWRVILLKPLTAFRQRNHNEY